jgi:hypothetical protein
MTTQAVFVAAAQYASPVAGTAVISSHSHRALSHFEIAVTSAVINVRASVRDVARRDFCCRTVGCTPKSFASVAGVIAAEEVGCAVASKSYAMSEATPTSPGSVALKDMQRDGAAAEGRPEISHYEYDVTSIGPNRRSIVT